MQLLINSMKCKKQTKKYRKSTAEAIHTKNKQYYMVFTTAKNINIVFALKVNSSQMLFTLSYKSVENAINTYAINTVCTLAYCSTF